VVLAGGVARADVGYHVLLDARAHHVAHVIMSVAGVKDGVDLWMPAWTPGAYEIRDWGRNVTPFNAWDRQRQPLAFTRTGPNTFHVAGSGDVTIVYEVFAALASDDGSTIDDTHALLNGSSIFLAVRGREHERHGVGIALPAGWRSISALGEVMNAASYEELIDAPIECGRFATATTTAAGREVTLALDGAAISPTTMDGWMRDVAALVATETKLVGAPPWSRYVILVHLTDAPGKVAALEHAASTSILMPTSTLTDRESYDELVYVIAHEMFHAWNARRLRPAELVPYDLSRAQPSRNLWITEGLTEYYAHRAMLLSRRWSRAAWLAHTSDEAERAVLASRRGGSIEEAALLAWRAPDDAADDPDAYYARGHLVALALDAAIRAAGDGKHSLDDVLRALLAASEKAGGVLPVDGDSLAKACDLVAPGVGAQLLSWTREPHEIEKLTPVLQQLGLGLRVTPLSPRASADFAAELDGHALRVTALLPDGAAVLAGLRSGDRITAVDGVAPDANTLKSLGQRAPDSTVALEVRRARTRLQLRLQLAATPSLEAKLELQPATPRILRLRDAYFETH
jgi:predicted metalloprotease with PDZ domain